METHKSRTSNSVRNASITTITQVVGIVVSFINRTLFIHYLGIDYLSVNGLFVNILAILSFAELGIGSAITFTLYKPISDKNNDKINAILNIYRKAYRWIAIAITVLGLSVIPFLSSIVKDVPSVNSEVQFSIDPNTCIPLVKGQIIAEGDEKKVNARIQAQVKACKQGLV